MIRFYNVELSRVQSFEYSGYSVYHDAYGKLCALSMFYPGDAVKISLFSGRYEIAEMTKADDAWEMKDQYNYEIVSESEDLRYVKIGSAKYRIADSCMVFNEKEQIDFSSISGTDIITLRGYDRTVNAIIVEEGHGNVTFSGTEDYEGGIVVIGNDYSAVITKDLSIDVREGSYTLSAANNGLGGSTTIDVHRDENTKVDLTRLDGDHASKKYSEVTFSITPKKTVLKINGKKTAYKNPVTLAYGTYAITLEAPGYDAVTRILMVNSPKATVELDVPSLLGDESTASSDESGNANVKISGKGSSSSDEDEKDEKSTTSGATDITDTLSSTLIDEVLDSILGTDDDSSTSTDLTSLIY